MTDIAEPLGQSLPRPNWTALRQGVRAKWSHARVKLGDEIPPYSLAAFRIIFGVLLIWDVLRYISNDWITHKYVTPDFFFAYELAPFLKPLPEPFIHWVWIGVGVSAVMITIGAFYRAAVAAFILSYGYFFLLDKAQYMNHHYLVLLFAILLLAVPAHRAWSVDSLWRKIPQVQRGHRLLLILQIEIVLIFAGLVKISADWLQLEPLRSWLQNRSDDVFYGALFQYDAIIAAGAYGTIALHIFGAPLMLWKRTRIWVFAAYCAFHISNSQLFNIGIFPWLTIGATSLLFAPDWPQQLVRFVQRKPHTPEAGYNRNNAQTRQLLSRSFLVFLILWTSVQIALPLRSGLYNNEVRWTGQGHRFSWRMKIYDRDAIGDFYVVDPVSGDHWFVRPKDHLSKRQVRKMMVRPDMIVQFAHHLEDHWHESGYRDVAVHARIYKSLNGRDHENYVTSAQDLTALRTGALMPVDWLASPRPTKPLPSR